MASEIQKVRLSLNHLKWKDNVLQTLNDMKDAYTNTFGAADLAEPRIMTYIYNLNVFSDNQYKVISKKSELWFTKHYDKTAESYVSFFLYLMFLISTDKEPLPKDGFRNIMNKRMDNGEATFPIVLASCVPATSWDSSITQTHLDHTLEKIVKINNSDKFSYSEVCIFAKFIERVPDKSEVDETTLFDTEDVVSECARSVQSLTVESSKGKIAYDYGLYLHNIPSSNFCNYIDSKILLHLLEFEVTGTQSKVLKGEMLESDKWEFVETQLVVPWFDNKRSVSPVGYEKTPFHNALTNELIGIVKSLNAKNESDETQKESQMISELLRLVRGLDNQLKSMGKTLPSVGEPPTPLAKISPATANLVGKDKAQLKPQTNVEWDDIMF